MPYIAPEVVLRAKRMDLLTYLNVGRRIEGDTNYGLKFLRIAQKAQTDPIKLKKVDFELK